MDKTILFFFAVITLILSSSCDRGETNPKTIGVESVTLDNSEIELEEGTEYDLIATVYPENADNKKVKWESDMPDVVSVNEGHLTALRVGKAIITVETEDGGFTSTCSVIVKAKSIIMTHLSLSHKNIELNVGDEFLLTVTPTPEEANTDNLVWTSSDEFIVSVTAGKLKANNEGKATITVTDSENTLSASCYVSIITKEFSNDDLGNSNGNW